MLEAKNIHKLYHLGQKAIEVLKGIDLTIMASEFVAITGPSGAGKSTLLHILGGLDQPTHGSLTFAGENIYKLSDASLCRVRNEKIGFVFQFYHLLADFNVLENVMMPALISQTIGPGKKEGQRMKEKALELISQTGLERRIGHFPSQLSGGEQQRVAVVRALMNDPSLLLCDEPTGNLDSKTGSEIISLIKKIHQAKKMAVVLVTHNTELAKASDKVYHLKDGVLAS